MASLHLSETISELDETVQLYTSSPPGHAGSLTALSVQVSIKRFLKRNLADVSRDESMNALADKAQKQGMPHSDMHSITRPHYPTTIPT